MMSDGYVIKIKQNDLQDDYTFEELKPGTPECIRHEKYEKEYKIMLSNEAENASQNGRNEKN